MAENCLPFSSSESILDLCKALCRDIEAVEKTKMKRSAATYIMTHGVAEHVKSSLSMSLQKAMFSMNIDEATNNSGNKVVNVLVQYYCEDSKKIVSEVIN